MNARTYDAVVVGSGPNGLGAAIALARRGLSVLVVEGAKTVGGGARSSELTLPGFVHDVCSAVHPLGVGSPFFGALPLEDHGLAWVHPPVPLAHPLDDGPAALLKRPVEEAAKEFGPDATAYRQLFEPLAADAVNLFADLLGPVRWPKHLSTAIRFGWQALRSGRGLAEAHFRGKPARALIAGLSAHAVLPLEQRPGAAIALMLGVAGHAVGWPMPRGGAQKIADALTSYFRSLGGEVVTGQPVKSLKELPSNRALLLDLTPRQVIALAGDSLPASYRSRLARYRYGPAAFKLDWALSGPIPWRAPECAQAGTVHLGGTLEEIAASERQVWDGAHPHNPFVLLSQPSLFDPSRAPKGHHTAWAYCHVPNGSTFDMAARIEAQVERFAPGFRDLIMARHVLSPADLELHNPNYIGGDINGGIADLWQLFARPVASLDPYKTPVPGLYLCSSSTPPGAGVHGMCGYFAAQSVLRDLKGRQK